MYTKTKIIILIYPQLCRVYSQAADFHCAILLVHSLQPQLYSRIRFEHFFDLYGIKWLWQYPTKCNSVLLRLTDSLYTFVYLHSLRHFFLFTEFMVIVFLGLKQNRWHFWIDDFSWIVHRTINSELCKWFQNFTKILFKIINIALYIYISSCCWKTNNNKSNYSI